MKLGENFSQLSKFDSRQRKQMTNQRRIKSLWFSRISCRIYKNHQCTCCLLAATNNDVNAISSSIKNGIPGETTAYKYIGSVAKQSGVVNNPTVFLNSLDSLCTLPHCFNIGNWCACHSSPKHQSTAVSQRYKTFCDKDDEQCH